MDAGTKVYTYTEGFGGTPAVVNGIVTADGRVKLTDGASMFGGQRMRGYAKLTPDWTPVSELHPFDKWQLAKHAEEIEHRKACDREREELAAMIAASITAGNQHLDASTPYGTRVKHIRDGDSATVRTTPESHYVLLHFDGAPEWEEVTTGNTLYTSAWMIVA